jgi:hypothetical protein
MLVVTSVQELTAKNITSVMLHPGGEKAVHSCCCCCCVCCAFSVICREACKAELACVCSLGVGRGCVLCNYCLQVCSFVALLWHRVPQGLAVGDVG